MYRAITFTRFFPADHIEAGNPTYFAEKLLRGFPVPPVSPPPIILNTRQIFKPKLHTIRKGSNWKQGDVFTPKIWNGMPHESNLITLAPDQPVVKVMTFEIDGSRRLIDGKSVDFETQERLAENDGLELIDFDLWFPKQFKGQVICWQEVEYL